MARVWGNHFIVLHMRKNGPLPPIFVLWKHHCHPIMTGLPDVLYKEQLALFMQLRQSIPEEDTSEGKLKEDYVKLE